MTDVSVPSIIAALTLALVLSVAIGWRALSLTLAVLALTLMGVLRALRFGVDPTSLRALVYGTLPWWLGHTAFASLSVESAGLGLLFGLAYRALMAEGESAPSLIALISPQVVLTLGLFAGSQPLGALIVALAIVAQIALHSFLKSTAFAQRAQIWLMLAMLAAAISLIVSPFSIF